MSLNVHENRERHSVLIPIQINRHSKFKQISRILLSHSEKSWFRKTERANKKAKWINKRWLDSNNKPIFWRLWTRNLAIICPHWREPLHSIDEIRFFKTWISYKVSNDSMTHVRHHIITHQYILIWFAIFRNLCIWFHYYLYNVCFNSFDWCIYANMTSIVAMK